MSDDDTLALLKRSCVYITGPEEVGTGYLITPDRVATALHTVRHWEEDECYNVRIGVDGEWCRARLRKTDPSHDAAILELLDPATAPPFSPASGATAGMEWRGYGFPVLAARTDTPHGIPFSGKVRDPKSENDNGQPAVLLQCNEVSAGNASPVHGLSGAPVVICGAVIGHVTKHIGDIDDRERPAYGGLFACPIGAVLELLDKPLTTVDVGQERLRPGEPGYFSQHFSTLEPTPLDPMQEAPHLIGLNDKLDQRLVTLARSRDEIDTDRLDLLLQGAHTTEQKARRDDFNRHTRTTLRSLDELISNYAGRRREIEQRLREIERESPPTRPTREVIQWGTTTDRQAYEAQQMIDRRHTLELAEYEQRLEKYRQNKAGVQVLASESDKLRHEIATLEQQANSVQTRAQIELATLDSAVDQARAQDIVRKLVSQIDLAEQETSAGPSSLLGLVRLGLVPQLAQTLYPWTGDSTLEVRRLAQEATARIESAVTRQFTPMASDILSRSFALERAWRLGSSEIRAINDTLEATDASALSTLDADTRSLIVTTAIPPAVSCRDLERPAEIDARTRTYANCHSQALTNISRCELFLQDSADHEVRVLAARDEAKSIQLRIGAIAQRYRPVRDELDTVWWLLGTLGGTQNTVVSSFYTALEAAVSQRIDRPLRQLLDDLASSHCHETSAAGALTTHASANFLASRALLVRHLEELRLRQGEYEQALRDIELQPERVSQKYRERLMASAVGATVPALNIAAAIWFVWALGHLEPALLHQQPAFVALRKQARVAMFIITGAAAIATALLVGVMLQNIHPIDFDEISQHPWILAMAASYPVTLIIAIFTWINPDLRRCLSGQDRPTE